MQCVSHVAKWAQKPCSAPAHRGFPVPSIPASSLLPLCLPPSMPRRGRMEAGAAWPRCLCFWPGQEKTCANSLLQSAVAAAGLQLQVLVQKVAQLRELVCS